MRSSSVGTLQVAFRALLLDAQALQLALQLPQKQLFTYNKFDFFAQSVTEEYPWS